MSAECVAVTQHKCRVCEQPKSSRDSHPSCFQCTGCLSENTCRYCKRWPRVQWKRLMVQYKSKSTPVLKEVVQYKSKSTPVLKELDMGLNLLSIPPLKRKETEAPEVLRMEGSRSDDGALWSCGPHRLVIVTGNQSGLYLNQSAQLSLFCGGFL